MRKLGDMIGDAFSRPEILRRGRAQMVMRAWREIVGDQLADKCVLERYDKGTLWIAASGNAWAQEIRFQKTIILERMNEMAGENLFSNLRVGTRPPTRDFSMPLND